MTEAEFVRLWQQERPRLYRRALWRLCGNEEQTEEAMGRLTYMACRKYRDLPAEGQDGFSMRIWLLTYLRAAIAHTLAYQRRVRRCPSVLSLESDIETAPEERLLRSAVHTQAQEAAHVAARYQAARSALCRVCRPETAAQVAAYLQGETGAISRQRVSQIVQKARQEAEAEEEDSGRDWRGADLFALGAAVPLYVPSLPYEAPESPAPEKVSVDPIQQRIAAKVLPPGLYALWVAHAEGRSLEALARAVGRRTATVGQEVRAAQEAVTQAAKSDGLRLAAPGRSDPPGNG